MSKLYVNEIHSKTGSEKVADVKSDGTMVSDQYFQGKNHPCFLYERISSHSTAAELIIFNTERIDTHDAMNTTSGKYIIPVAGIWEFNFSMMTMNNTQSGHFYISLYQNSDDKYRLYNYKESGQHTRVTGAGLLLDCAVGDEVYLYNQTGGTVNLYGSGTRYSTFSGKLVG